MKLKTPLKKLALSLSTTAVVLGMVSCDPVPRRTLSTEEKIADLYWIYSQYGENYAPLEYKQKTLKIDFEKLKADYIEAAKKTSTNEEFYDLMFKFVAEFKDAHNSASLTNASLPDRAQVAFLGFSGVRNGDALLVKKLLPTITKDSAYPIKKDDLITKIDGVSLKDFIKTELLALRNLGNEESNYTYHMNKIFTRISTSNGLPKKSDAEITVMRGDAELTVTLPWVVKDLYQFQAEQTKATSASAQTPNAENYLMLSEGLGQNPFKFNLISFSGRIQKPAELIQSVMDQVRQKFTDGFRFVDDVSQWNPLADTDEPKSPLDLLKEQRAVMKDAVYLSDSKIYPAYIAPRAVTDKDGKETGETKLVGYVYIDTFSPSAVEDDVIKEFKSTIASMQAMGVNHLIIDTINNGGGSLVLGMKLAQLLSNKKIELPKMQMRLSDSWLDQFQKETINSNSDSEGELARRVLKTMTESQKAGKRLSEAYSAEVLAPFAISPNSELKKPFKVVLLVNEMCASMCDIFAGMLQDNKMATIVGTRTMGAGGNVVNYRQAPNSHLELRQTESLIVRKDGSYIENNGVTPDKEIAVNIYAKVGYRDVLKEGLNQLLGLTQVKKADDKKDDGKPVQK